MNTAPKLMTRRVNEAIEWKDKFVLECGTDKFEKDEEDTILKRRMHYNFQVLVGISLRIIC